MKNFTLIPAVLLTLTSANTLASGYNCKAITGTVNQLLADENTDVTFFYPTIPDFLPASCFYNTLTARLGNREVTGAVYSGLTQNTPLLGTNYQFSAASVISLKLLSTGSLLGRIFTKDMIITPFDFGLPSSTREFVTTVNGTNIFNDVQGNIEVLGNLIEGDRAFLAHYASPQTKVGQKNLKIVFFPSYVH